MISSEIQESLDTSRIMSKV